MQVTQLGSNVTLERCEVQTVQNVTNVNCQYQNEDFKTDTGDKTAENQKTSEIPKELTN